ncbi:MAG: hypothetical protein II543_05405, partial [Desulfovibrio sp.]|nr:hypothetical protein [Desulfovibrio sp.]
MPLIGPKEMFEAAYAGQFAIGAFNVHHIRLRHDVVTLAVHGAILLEVVLHRVHAVIVETCRIQPLGRQQRRMQP